MRELKTNFGILYIEEPTDNKQDEDRYVIEDSQHRWFDYFTVECVEETWGDYEKFFDEIQAKLLTMTESIDEILDYFGINAYTVSENWEDLLEDLYDENDYEYDEKDGKYYLLDGIDYSSESGTQKVRRREINTKTILENEWVNKVGDYFIFVADI